MRATFRFLAPVLCVGLGLAACSDKSTQPQPEPQPTTQYISQVRPWRPGERDSTIAYILRTGAWGAFSDAATSLRFNDSTVDVIPNPAWSASPPAGVQLAPQFDGTFSTVAVDIRIVFYADPPTNTIRDSLNWAGLQWWVPTEGAWHGFLYNATPGRTYSAANVDSTTFDLTNGASGVGGGESRAAIGGYTSTWWKAIQGQIAMTKNSGCGAKGVIASGPYLGGNTQTCTMSGSTTGVTMTRQPGGTSPPSPNTVSYTWKSVPGTRITCYFVPFPIPTGGWTPCTGVGFSRLIEAARTGRNVVSLLASRTGEGLPAVTPRQQTPR